MSEKKINYKQMPVPSSPGAQQITVRGTEAKKGSAPLTGKLPADNMIKGSDKK